MSRSTVRVLVLYNEPSSDASTDEADVLRQKDAVCDVLHGLGYDCVSCGCTLDLSVVRGAVLDSRPDVVFNLVESLAGSDRLAPLVPLLLDAMEIPYTGSPARALLATASKVDMKVRLRRAGLPTPDWLSPSESRSGPGDSPQIRAHEAFILKPVWEHASVGIDDDAIVSGLDLAAVRAAASERASRSGRPIFAEEFIDGREFNLSVLEVEGGLRVLPPAEIEFSSFPSGKPRIVGFRAKWDEESFECVHTPRSFRHDSGDAVLIERLQDLARRCWELFGLRGYARVDFRVDAAGSPWILEVNSNPCLSPDAGFAAALEAAALEVAGASYELGIQEIVGVALGGDRERRNRKGRRQ